MHVLGSLRSVVFDVDAVRTGNNRTGNIGTTELAENERTCSVAAVKHLQAFNRDPSIRINWKLV